MAKPQLLASAESLDGILALIARFYGGEQKLLSHCGVNNVWLVQGSRGTISGVRVVQKGRRYRFESVES
jgi:hypothetical protein